MKFTFYLGPTSIMNNFNFIKMVEFTLATFNNILGDCSYLYLRFWKTFFLFVCVFFHDNSKIHRSRNTKLEYIVVYKNIRTS